MNRLSSQAKLPGFRPGKMPPQVIKKRFGNQIHEDTVQELVRSFYVEAIEASGLKPAVQPELEVPAIQPAAGFEFSLMVATWPEVKLKDLKRMVLILT